MKHVHDFKARPLSGKPSIHAMGCRCRRCAPGAPSAGERFAVIVFAGLGLGMVAAKIVDLAVGGPGVLSIFGVNS